MSDLPDGWVETTIGAVTSDVQQRQPHADDEFKYIDISSIDRLTKQVVTPQILRGDAAPSRARKVVVTGDVLVSMTRPNLNAVALIDANLNGEIASTGFEVLRPLEIEPRWLFYLVRSDDFVQAMSDLVQGALYPAVRSKDVRSYILPVAPLKEQKRIADKLDVLLEQVDICRQKLDRASAYLKQYRQAVLSAATSGQLTEDWRAANTSEVDIDKELPFGWRLGMLSELCASINDGDHQPPPTSSEGVPFLVIGNISSGHLDFTNTRFVPREYFESIKAERRPQKGDVLYTVVGASLGIPVKVDTSHEFCFQRHIAILKPLRTTFPGYLYLVLQTEKVYRQSWNLATGTAQPTLPLGALRSIQVPVAPPEEQAVIVNRVGDLFKVADAFEKRLAAISCMVDRLTPAILAKAFRGELVPQDPNDEPASALLERIRAARQEAETRPQPAVVLRRPTMPKMDRQTAMQTIELLPRSQFRFDDIYARMPGDYESLKEIMFNLLNEAPTLFSGADGHLNQIFDREDGSVRFVRGAQ